MITTEALNAEIASLEAQVQKFHDLHQQALGGLQLARHLLKKAAAAEQSAGEMVDAPSEEVTSE